MKRDTGKEKHQKWRGNEEHRKKESCLGTRREVKRGGRALWALEDQVLVHEVTITIHGKIKTDIRRQIARKQNGGKMRPSIHSAINTII
jgi:hypothetical protein